MAHSLANPARNSQAHAALDQILAGVAIDRAACGYEFEDGSALTRDAVVGWIVSACIMGCKCRLGKRVTSAQHDVAWRHRDGLIIFE